MLSDRNHWIYRTMLETSSDNNTIKWHFLSLHSIPKGDWFYEKELDERRVRINILHFVRHIHSYIHIEYIHEIARSTYIQFINVQSSTPNSIENLGICPYPSFNTIISASLNPISVSKSLHGIMTTAESTISKYAVGTIHYPFAVDLIFCFRIEIEGCCKKKLLLLFFSLWYLHLRQEY
ncbi:hypothetical protein EYC80_008137 [Monilinia laxa]|uniref:Uncharacterized protein n=1 Tax=Monilinia laxa TaxID=61186 RepID=A0A5N6JUA2_MONLA|nr:hypothetical protein EYC80_008137 [Monilinia laxa]